MIGCLDGMLLLKSCGVDCDSISYIGFLLKLFPSHMTKNIFQTPDLTFTSMVLSSNISLSFRHWVNRVLAYRRICLICDYLAERRGERPEYQDVVKNLSITSADRGILTETSFDSRTASIQQQQSLMDNSSSNSFMFSKLNGSVVDEQSGNLKLSMMRQSRSQPSQLLSMQLPPIRTRHARSFRLKRDKMAKKSGFDENFGRPTPRCLRGSDSSGQATISVQELREELRVAKAGVAALDELVENNIVWVQNNCDKSLFRRSMFSDRTKQKCRGIAMERIVAMLKEYETGAKNRALIKWKTVVFFLQMKRIACLYLRAKAIEIFSRVVSTAVYRHYHLAWFRWSTRVALKKRFEQEAAAIEIQRVSRGRLGRVVGQEKRRQFMATRIQSVIRMFLARRRVTGLRESLRRDRAARVIQKTLRGFVAIAKAKREVYRRRCERSSRSIQRMLRGRAARARVAAMRKENVRRMLAAVTLQRRVRGMAGRARVSAMRRRIEELRRQEEAKHVAAITIQCAGRQTLARARVREARERARVALLLQERLDREAAEKRAKEEALRRAMLEQDGATVIQSQFRKRRAVLVAMELREEKTLEMLKAKK